MWLLLLFDRLEQGPWRRGSRTFRFSSFNSTWPSRSVWPAQNAFGDLFAVDERAVRRIEVFDDDIPAAQQAFAMMAGNGRSAI